MTCFVGSHALVIFEAEQCTAVVPKERVFVKEDDGCDVMWTNKKMYKAKILLLGSFLGWQGTINSNFLWNIPVRKTIVN